MWFWRPKTKVREGDFEVLAKHIHAITLRLQALEEKHEALAAAHERLRGRFYATKGPDRSEPQSKAEILREFGYMPGRPAPHK